MLETYKAIIHGDKIEWETNSPKILRTEKSVEVVITIVEKQTSSIANGKKMANILSKLTNKGGIKTIENPSDWQTEQRRERNLAEREK